MLSAVFFFDISTQNNNMHLDSNLRMSSSSTITPFKVGVAYGPRYLDPQLAWESNSFEVIDQICEGLFTYDLADPELKIIPHLASDYGSWNLNGTEYTVLLRQNVLFHDGTIFNASAVNFTWQRMAWALNTTGTNYEFRTQLEYLYKFPSGIPIVKEVRINSAYNVTFILNGPYAPFEALLCFSGSYILSPFSTPVTEYIDTNTGDLVGTGPFVYDYYVNNFEVSFHAFDNYWRGKASIDILVFSIISNSNLRNEALLKNGIHFLSNPSSSFLENFTADPNITVLDFNKTAGIIEYLGVNNILINRTFREVISYSINYSYIIDVLKAGRTMRMSSPIPTGIRYANDSFNLPNFNITHARMIMQSMGFGVGFDPTFPGITEDNWTNNVFVSYNFTYNEKNSYRESIFLLLQNNLNKTGIQITNASTSWLTFIEILEEKGAHHRNELELYIFGYMPDFNDPSLFIDNFYTNSSIRMNGAQYNGFTEAQLAGRNPYYLWDNVQLLMEEALIERNPVLREALYDGIQELLIDDMPYIWLNVPKLYHAHHINLTGFQQNALNKLDFYSCTWESYDITVSPPWPFILAFVVTLLVLIGFVASTANFISLRKWHNQEFLRKKRRKLKELSRNIEEREKEFNEFFTDYKTKTSNIDDYSKNLEYACNHLKKDKEEIVSLKLKPLEYKDDLPVPLNKSNRGFGNARIYPDEYKDLREIVKSKSYIKDSKPLCLAEWKNDIDSLKFSLNTREILLFEHESGLELYFHYVGKLMKELLVDFIEEIVGKKIEDFLVELLDELIELIDDYIKKKKKGKNVDRASIPDKYCIELRHSYQEQEKEQGQVVKILKKKRKKKKDEKLSFIDQLREALSSKQSRKNNKPVKN